MSEQNEDNGARKRIDTIVAFLSKIGELDIDGAGKFLHDDAQFDLPYLDDLAPTEGKAAILKQISITVPVMFDKIVLYKEYLNPLRLV